MNRRARFLPPGAFLPPELAEGARRLEGVTRGRPRQSALLLAGCEDFQVSYDAWFGNRANGAYTYAALAALRTQPPTFREWQHRIRALLPSQDFDQRPQLVGTSDQKRWPVFG